MNTTDLTKSFAEKYIDVDSISSVIALSGMTAVTEVSTSASSYTFEINKNYKWIPSSSGAKTVNFAVYTGEVHGTANLYVDLTNGGTLSFDSYVNIVGKQIDNSVNKVILEWWGSVKTAYLNCEIGSTNEPEGQQVNFVFSVYHVDEQQINANLNGDLYEYLEVPIYEACGNYYDTGFTKNSKPVYSNGEYSLYFRTKSNMNKWVFVQDVPSADNFNSANQYLDVHTTKNTATPVGLYNDGSIVVEYGSSLAPTISGLCAFFSFTTNDSVARANLNVANCWHFTRDGSLNSASGITCNNVNNYSLGKLPYGFSIVNDTYGNPTLSSNGTPYPTTNYISGINAESPIATSFITGWASNKFGDALSTSVMTAFIGVDYWRPGWPPSPYIIINDDPYIPDNPNPCDDTGGDDPGNCTCCGDPWNDTGGEDPGNCGGCGCGGYDSGYDDPCACGGGDYCCGGSGCDNACGGSGCDSGCGSGCDSGCGSGCDSGCGSGCDYGCGSGCDNACGGSGCDNACGGGNACGDICGGWYCSSNRKVTSIASVPNLVFDELIVDVESMPEDKFDEDILGTYHEDGTYMNKHKVYTNDKGYYIAYRGDKWVFYKTYPGEGKIQANGGNGYTDPSGTYTSLVVESLTLKVTLNNTKEATK